MAARALIRERCRSVFWKLLAPLSPYLRMLLDRESGLPGIASATSERHKRAEPDDHTRRGGGDDQ
jgi:hypothetical protein